MHRVSCFVSVLVALAACNREPSRTATTLPKMPTQTSSQRAAQVDHERLRAAAADGTNWLSYGRTYDEQRFSPLQLIDEYNVGQLKLAWHYDLPADRRAQEATPLVIDGTLYVTSAWSKVFALNAATGSLLWSYDPKVSGATGVDACCDVVNRGVAAWDGRIYLGALDGRLIALDAHDGTLVWEVRTTPTGSRYTITGAPRVVKGKVIIGNGGGDAPLRGYVSAYDARSGALVWRFYTVPGEPGKADGVASDQVLQSKARTTWKGEWWKLGGGATVWDAMAYDPELDLLYFGTDNGGPWNRALRSPGGGDNLFAASILAVRPDTGQYVWHYQTTPGDSWDYSATQHLILADLVVEGVPRKVIMQAPKNGFFYLLERASGKLLSAQQYVDHLNWAQGVDPRSGRPLQNAAAQYGDRGKPALVAPGPSGGHNWQPMAFSPLSGLVYIPVTESSFPFVPLPKLDAYKLSWNLGIDLAAINLPPNPAVKAAAKAGLTGRLSAWNPVTQKEVWRAQIGQPWNGGVLATAGNLVFQGDAMGEISARQANTGRKLWSFSTGTGILAPPVTYRVGSEQFIAIEVGWGGAFALSSGELARDRHVNRGNVPRVLGFSLGGMDSLTTPPVQTERKLHALAPIGDEAQVSHGKSVYHRFCSGCHGAAAVSGGVLPDLRFAAALTNEKLWQAIVHEGALQVKGMVAFGSELSTADVESLRAYVTSRVNETVAEEAGLAH